MTSAIIVAWVNPQTAGVPYKKQNHLHGQQREFRKQNNAQKTKENDVKTISSSLAYLILTRLSFCMSTGERERLKKKKKKKKKNRNRSETSLFYIQVNDKE